MDADDNLPKFLNFPEPFGGDGLLYEGEETTTKEHTKVASTPATLETLKGH